MPTEISGLNFKCNMYDRRDREKKNASHKRDVLNRYKRRKGCVDCGYKKDFRALEFDHVDEATKIRTVASCCYSSWVVIKAEVAKCVIRCCNCHAIITHGRGQYGR